MKMRDLALLISTFLVVAFLGVAALLAVSSASAQTSTTGNIEGTVVDVTGAAVPGISVTATNQTGRTASGTTNDEGFFRITNLEPGRYTVTVEAGKGSAKFEQANVEVNLTRSTNVGIQLRPAGAAETVEVTSSSSATVERATPTTAATNAGKVTTSGGLTTVTFDTKFGNVRVNLPDDMRAGDTISGTVVAEPKGDTPEKRAENAGSLQKGVVRIGKDAVNLNCDLKADPPCSPKVFTTRTDEKAPSLSVVLEGVPGFQVVGNPVIPLREVTLEGAPSITIDPVFTTTSRGSYSLATIGQQGRPLEIFGPFDGNASNTTLRFGPVGSTVPDFEKGTENVSGGFGLIKPLAESPRKMVFECPSNVTGPVTILVKEGNGAPTTGTMRNVGVQLSAPKTNLMRGEKTTVTIQVSGLQGIKKDVPLQLDSKGVITMEGGNFQNLRIKPQEVKQDGTYTTDRGITGQQAGGFTVTATVIVSRFDFRLQDDTDPNRLFHFNSFTGDYVFACGGGSCRSGTGGTSGQPPTGGSVPPIPVTLTGTGKPVMKGCIITLSHNAPDRRVFARLDACTKTGDASVQTTSPKTEINITDKNTTDNAVASPPK
jgi:hypothetical protein